MEPDETEPFALQLPDGRVVLFYDYDFTPATAGSFFNPPDPAEGSITGEAWWATPDIQFGEQLTEEELTWLHDDEKTCIALVDLLEDFYNECCGDDEDYYYGDSDDE